MTITEADEILNVVSSALQDTSHRHHPVSALQGYDLQDICIALKLRIANERLQLAHMPDFEMQFAEGLKLYDSIPWQIMMSFVPDDQVDDISALGVFNPIDPCTMAFKNARLAGMETGASFGEYCKSLAPEDPHYWEKVFARIGRDPRRNIWEKARDGYWPIATWIVLLFSLDMVGMWRVIVLGITLAAAITLTVLLRRWHQRQGKNGTPGWTILGAVAVMFFWGGVARIIETRDHQGPGIVIYGDGERSPEREELVDESAYKRHHYTMGALFFGFGVLCLYLLRVLWNNERPRKETG